MNQWEIQRNFVSLRELTSTLAESLSNYLGEDCTEVALLRSIELIIAQLEKSVQENFAPDPQRIAFPRPKKGK